MTLSKSKKEVESLFKHLTDYEKQEISSYYKCGIYYIGEGSDKVDEVSPIPVSVYHDINSNYRVRIHDHISYRYEVLKIIGKGSFSVVVKAYDHKNNEDVAIKIVKSTENCAYTAEREVSFLYLLHSQAVKKGLDSSYIIKPKDKTYFRGHVCIVLEYLHNNLFTAITQHSTRLVKNNIKRITKCILKALTVLQECNVIHSDIKPDNILVNDSGTEAKLCDFNNSLSTSKDFACVIQNEFYRAPEVHLRMTPYTRAVDMWSLGCVIINMLTGLNLFTGKTISNKITKMVKILGMPPDSMWKNAKPAKKLFDDYIADYKNLSESKSSSGNTATQNSNLIDYVFYYSKDQDFTDFVVKCMTWDPKERITAPQALAHKWIAAD